MKKYIAIVHLGEKIFLRKRAIAGNSSVMPSTANYCGSALVLTSVLVVGNARRNLLSDTNSLQGQV